MNTADLSIVVNGIEVLALIGTIGALFYFRRFLLAASPKPQPQKAGAPKAKDEPVPGDVVQHPAARAS